MKVETHNHLGEPLIIECTRLVVRDFHNNPVVVVLEHAPGHIWTKRVGDPDYDRALELMGISDTVVVSVLDSRDLRRPPGELLLPPGTR